MHSNFETNEDINSPRCQNNQDSNFNIVYVYGNSKFLIRINSRWWPHDLQKINNT